MSVYGRCESSVLLRGLNFARSKPCGRPGKVASGGRWFCGIHDPTKKKAAELARAEYEQLQKKRYQTSRTLSDVRDEIIDDIRARVLNPADAHRCLIEAEAADAAAVEKCAAFRCAHPELRNRRRAR